MLNTAFVKPWLLSCWACVGVFRIMTVLDLSNPAQLGAENSSEFLYFFILSSQPVRGCVFCFAGFVGSVNTFKPSGEEERKQVISSLMVITAEPCEHSCWVCLTSVFTVLSLTKPSEEGERHP